MVKMARHAGYAAMLPGARVLAATRVVASAFGREHRCDVSLLYHDARSSSSSFARPRQNTPPHLRSHGPRLARLKLRRAMSIRRGSAGAPPRTALAAAARAKDTS